MKKFLLSSLLIASLSMPLAAQACTLYAAQGDVVEGGGTLITKIRDFQPQNQELRVVRKGKYAYFGLFSGTSPDKYIVKAGVNEKGLVAVSAMASCIPEKERRKHANKAVLRRVLAECSTVDEALQHPEFYYGPKFVMLGDAKEIACVEIGAEGKTSVKRTANDSLAHTNYYLDEKFAELNMRVKESPRVRYQRINELLQNTAKPYTLDDFIAFSQDQNDGLDNSLWRFGSSTTISQTLAAFIVRVEPDSSFTVWLKYRPEIEDRGHEIVVEKTREDIFG